MTHPDRRVGLAALALVLTLAAGTLRAADTKKTIKVAKAEETAKADETQTDEVRQSGRVIVVAPNASVQLQDADPKRVAPGEVFEYSIINGDWLWSDRHWGWVKRDDTVEVDEAIEHFTGLIEEGLAAGTPEGTREAALSMHYRGVTRLALDEPEKAIKDFELAQRQGLNDAPLLMNIATTYRLTGDLDKALAAATEAVRQAPESSRAHDVRSLILYDLDQYEASLIDSNRAVKLDEQNAEAVNNRGVTKSLMGRYRDAAEDYTAALKIAPRHPQALANRGYVLKKLGRFPEAVRDYQRALKVSPDSAVASNDLAWLLATCDDDAIRSPEEAIRHAERAVELAPNDGRFLDTLAAAYAAAGDFEKATETGMQAVELLTDAEQYEADQRVELYIKGKPYIEKPAK